MEDTNRFHELSEELYDAVKEYLDKGVLDALISVDSYQLGYQALQSVFEICQNGNTSSYVNTGFDFLKKSEDTQK